MIKKIELITLVVQARVKAELLSLIEDCVPETLGA